MPIDPRNKKDKQAEDETAVEDNAASEVSPLDMGDIPEDSPDAQPAPEDQADPNAEEAPEDGDEPFDPESELGQDDGIEDVEPDPIVNDMRDIKLYDLMIALESYIEYFISAISNIDQSQLTADQNTKMVSYYGDMKKDLDDLKFYVQNEYENNDYHKNLYSYLLFNKALAQTVRHVRNTLSLKASDLSQDDENKDKRKQS